MSDMMEIIKNAEGRNVVEFKAIRLIREYFGKENSRYCVEIRDTDIFSGSTDILPEYRNLTIRFKDETGAEKVYTIAHNHFDGNSVQVCSEAVANVLEGKESAALRAINAFNVESCACLVMETHAPFRGRIRFEGSIPDKTADEDVGSLVEDLILLMEDEWERAIESVRNCT